MIPDCLRFLIAITELHFISGKEVRHLHELHQKDVPRLIRTVQNKRAHTLLIFSSERPDFEGVKTRLNQINNELELE